MLAVDFRDPNGLGQFLFRWGHVVAGITWIGLLYYFNLVQVSAFARFEDDPHKEIGGRARLIALDKIATRALWWFRWGAVFTFLTGILITGVIKDYYSAPDGFSWMRFAGNSGIVTGMLIGTIMLLNVWGVIWRNQKVVLANAANVLAGNAPDPNVPAAARRAGMASRQNFIFSVPLVYWMIFRQHHPDNATYMSSSNMALYWVIALIIIVVLEINALGFMPWKAEANKGMNQMYDGPGVRNPLISAFGLFVVFYVLEVLFFNT